MAGRSRSLANEKNQRLAIVESLAQNMSGRARVLNALRGVVPALVAMPLVLRVWSPTWFVIAWFVVYALMSAGFMVLALTRPSPLVEQAWSVSAAALFCAVPISSTIWSGEPQDFWASATVGMIFIAFEISALPFLRIGEWRAGILLLGLTMTVCGVISINPIVALALAPLVLAMVHASDRMRQLKLELEAHLTEAHAAIRHDALTGVLNRRGLTSCLEDLEGQELTVALIDVDRFKIINDTHGHQVGDQVLVALAQTLTARFGDQFSIGRLGGDEFVAIAAGEIALDSSVAAPTRVTTTMHEQELVVDCGLSIGVSYGLNTDSAHRLLSEAGFAMRESKRSESKLSMFDGDLSHRLDRMLQVAAMAAGGVGHGAFVPVAQTIVDGDRVVGCELLIRWQRPDGELLSPAQFLPSASEAGLMSLIDNLMLDHAVRFAARFNNRPDAPFVSVNIAAPHLGETDFCARVEALLAEHRVPPERLMIEITENEQFGGFIDWEDAAIRLRKLGVNLAIDDFGTGYSTIERLQHLPISHLKFDRSLVQTVSGPFGQIVRGVAGFAKSVNIGVIAEGVETLDELESVRAFGIATFQGYFFHRPEHLDAVERLIIEDYLRVADGTVAAETVAVKNRLQADT